MAEGVESKQEQELKPSNEADKMPAKDLGLKLETYGLVLLALVTSAFYLFWLVLVCVGTTRLPHH